MNCWNPQSLQTTGQPSWAVAWRGFGGSDHKIFLCPSNCVSPRKIWFEHTIRTKILPP